MRFQKRTTIIAISLASLSFLSCSSSYAALADGTYAGEAKGNNGPIALAVTIEGQQIRKIELTKSNETPGLGTEAIRVLSDEIIAQQSLGVDAVTGATNSSEALKSAIRQALKAAGGTEADLAKSQSPVPDKAAPSDVSTDIVVVGAGGAGMTAAIAAKEHGAEVILLEKLPVVGGTTLLASTALNAGGSSVQMAMPKPYTRDDYLKKLEAGAGGKDLVNVRQLADLSGETVDWLIGMGADLSRVINGSQHTPKDGGALGISLVPVLKNRIDALGIDTRTQNDVMDLIIGSDGRVSGVRVKAPQGSYEIHAKAVILATGGFASNPELVKKYTPQWYGYPSTASVGATGDGIVMAEKAGAALAQMSKAGPQTVAYDTGRGAVSLTNVRYNGAILVNQKGVRFANELGSTAVLGKAITEQPGGVAYLIFDQSAVDHAALMKTYKQMGYFVEAPTIGVLAQKFGIPAEALGKTVAAWHEVYDTKSDKAFGRKDSIFSRIDKAPFYGQKISPASQTTYGGIVRDSKARALRSDGSVIPGLYAAGETACQYGQGVTIATVLGKLAGEEAAKEVAK